MRIDPDAIESARPEDREIALLAGEVRRLQAVIAAGEPTLTDAERQAVEFFVGFHNEGYGMIEAHAATLRNLLERLK